MRNYLWFTFLILTFPLAAVPTGIGKEENVRNYIENHLPHARNHVQTEGIPLSICLAMALLESNIGQSTLAVAGHNHFGIKADSLRWKGETLQQVDDDYDKNGKLRPSLFRKYKSTEESYADYAKFLKSNRRYAALFRIPTSDYTAWALGMQSTGYATDPRYAESLVETIERYALYEYDAAVKIQPIAAKRASQEKALINRKVRKMDYTQHHVSAKTNAMLVWPEQEETPSTEETQSAPVAPMPVHPKISDIEALKAPAVAPSVPNPTQKRAPMKAVTVMQPIEAREN